MGGHYEALEVFVTPPVVAAAGVGSRVVAATAVAVSVQLDNDILAAPGNTIPAVGNVLVRFTADGDDIFLLFGATGLVPDPTDVAGAGRCELIKDGTWVDYMLSGKNHPFVSYRSRTNAAKLRYRVSSPRMSIQ